MTQIEKLKKLKPCSEGLIFVQKHKSVMSAWKKCSRGDWMLWLSKRLKVDIRLLTLAKGLCANTVRHLMKDKRSTKAVAAAIEYGRGEIDQEELSAAATDAASAYAEADAEADAVSAYAATAAVSAYAAASASAASAAAYGAASAASAASAAAVDADAAREKYQKKTADICREILTDVVKEALKK